MTFVHACMRTARAAQRSSMAHRGIAGTVGRLLGMSAQLRALSRRATHGLGGGGRSPPLA